MSETVGRESSQVWISDYLKPGRMELDLQASTKEEAIRLLAETVKESDEVESFPVFLRDVYDREKIATTGIGCGIGIPHARTAAVKNFLMVFGRSKRGIPFEALDSQPVTFIFLLATPQDGLKDYLKLLSQLSRFMKDSGFRSKLETAETEDDVIELFKVREYGLAASNLSSDC